jgi:2-methylcitrate dehydratase
MPSLASRLVATTSAIRYATLPSAAVDATKHALLDALGCGIAAIGCEPARIASRALSNGAAEATVIGETVRSSLERAVLLNGILVRYLDMMDVYSANDVCHPAENVLLALASVESAQGNGKTLIEAIIAGYEAQLRLAHALSLQQMGMHHVAAAGIVAPIVIGKAWGLTPEVIEQAVALSGCRQFTLHALSKGRLSMAKAIGYAWSAVDSIFAVRLAREGFTGPVDFLDWLAEEGPLKGTVDEAMLDSELPDYLIEHVSYKQFPVQFELQTPVEIAIELYRRIRASGKNIARVEIEVRPITRKRTADPAKFAPQNRETADHSLPVCVAMALTDGEVTAHQFESGRWAAADISKLVQRIAVAASEDYEQRYAGGRPAGIRVHLEDRSVLAEFREAPLGDARRPMDRAAIEVKFLNNASPRLGRQRAEEIVLCVRELEHIDAVSHLTRLLFEP